MTCEKLNRFNLISKYLKLLNCYANKEKIHRQNLTSERLLKSQRIWYFWIPTPTMFAIFWLTGDLSLFWIVIKLAISAKGKNEFESFKIFSLCPLTCYRSWFEKKEIIGKIPEDTSYTVVNIKDVNSTGKFLFSIYQIKSYTKIKIIWRSGF